MTKLLYHSLRTFSFAIFSVIAFYLSLGTLDSIASDLAPSELSRADPLNSPQQIGFTVTRGNVATAALKPSNQGNRASIIQDGAQHQIQLSQRGNLNEAVLLQSGLSNYVDISQIGRENLVNLSQYGGGNRAYVDQKGNLNTARIEQYGIGGTATITQHGSGNRATTIQY
jgi:minor curlin subunit